jgi:hypothetical protein
LPLFLFAFLCTKFSIVLGSFPKQVQGPFQ